jgi:RNA polymerase sigma-70 factor (ECF subfamily)
MMTTGGDLDHDRHDERWIRLTELLGPIYENAARTARRLSRTPDDGDDLLQEAVLRAFDRLDTLRDPNRFRSWFFAVLLSVHRNRHRRAFWRRFLPLDVLREGGHEPVGADGAREAELRRRAWRASRALAQLPPEQREAIVLFEMEGYSIEEIAGFQNVSLSAVKSRLARGRERLRRFYERLDSDVAPTPSRSEREEHVAGRPRFVAD